eukprot:2183927-Rhodomonas_salina.1
MLGPSMRRDIQSTSRSRDSRDSLTWSVLLRRFRHDRSHSVSPPRQRTAGSRPRYRPTLAPCDARYWSSVRCYAIRSADEAYGCPILA